MAWWQREYIGTVLASSRYVDEDGQDMPGGRRRGRWILFIGFFGRRCAKLVGNPGCSAGASEVEARVFAWRLGGPLPLLDKDTRQQPMGSVLQLVKSE